MMQAPLMYVLAAAIGVASSSHALQYGAKHDSDPGTKSATSAHANHDSAEHADADVAACGDQF